MCGAGHAAARLPETVPAPVLAGATPGASPSGAPVGPGARQLVGAVEVDVTSWCCATPERVN